MISSRSLDDLHPHVQELAHNFLDACKNAGIPLLVTCTYRDFEAQDALYARGRTILTEGGHKVGKVTNAKGGQSYHNFHLAMDIVPLRNGKPVWGTSGADGALWNKLGTLGISKGFEWAGKWRTFKEFPHFQWTGGLSLDDLRAGRKP